MGSIRRAGVLRVLSRMSILVACLTWLSIGISAQNAKKSKRSEAQTVHALFVSDIHFEPFWDPGKVSKLVAAPVSEWKTILAAPDTADRKARFAELEQTCHMTGEDTSYALFASSLRAIRANAGDARFAIVSGDLISHSFSCKYATLFMKASPGAYRAFTEKTVEFVIDLLREALAGAPVYAALGNNDSDCGDYELDADSRFLATLAGEFTYGFAAADRQRATRTFAMGGYYSVRLPAPVTRTRLLVLDDLFMSRKYHTCGDQEDPAPAAAQIAWMERQLNAARQSREKVWVMAHIPPGVDADSMAAKRNDICKGSAPTMFLSSEALAGTMTRFGDVIRLGIFAHTHMDEVRLLEPAKAGGKGIAVKIVPSISPIAGNDPSFVVATIDPKTAVMQDYRVIAVSNKTGIDTTWAQEYDFAQTYRMPEFSASTLTDLVQRLEGDHGAQKDASRSYIRNYEVGPGVRKIQQIWQMYVCALNNDTASAFSGCLCGQ